MFLLTVNALENTKQANTENHTSLKIMVCKLHRIITNRGLLTHFLDFLTVHHKHQTADMEKTI
jgi:hypothetical protein